MITPETFGQNIIEADTCEDPDSPCFVDYHSLAMTFTLDALVAQQAQIWKRYLREDNAIFPVITPIFDVAEMQILDNCVATLQYINPNESDNPEVIGSMEAYWIGDGKCDWGDLSQQLKNQWGLLLGQELPEFPEDFLGPNNHEAAISAILEMRGRNLSNVQIEEERERLWITAGENPQFGRSQVIKIIFAPPRNPWQNPNEIQEIADKLSETKELEGMEISRVNMSGMVPSVTIGVASVFSEKEGTHSIYGILAENMGVY